MCTRLPTEAHDFQFRIHAEKWEDVKFAMINSFIACLLNVGVIRPTVASSFTSPLQFLTWFFDSFPRDDFQLLLIFFCLVENESLASPEGQGYYLFAKI